MIMSDIRQLAKKEHPYSRVLLDVEHLIQEYKGTVTGVLVSGGIERVVSLEFGDYETLAERDPEEGQWTKVIRIR